MSASIVPAVEKLKRFNAKRVFVQYPEGLKLRVQGIAKELEAAGFEVIVSVEPCYGACDLRDAEAKRLGCDALLHIGHEDFGVKSELLVVFWEYFIDTDPAPIIEKEFAKLKPYGRIGIVTSIQFVHAVEKARKFLEKNGKKVLTHKALQYEGQILGCNLDAALKIENDVDAFLCISAGKFYGLGLVMKTDKPMFCLDLEKGTLSDMDELKKRIQKTIAWNRAALDDAKRVALLVSWKRGQAKSPFELKKKLEAKGKEVIILAMDEITPEKLTGLKIDAALNLACPRIGIDDLGRYRMPVLNLEDAGTLI
ncbi:MAG: diphthamide biosynthesis enzyme Dph2 [Candidatus Aenigmarchaeota archaeon]|nr:diphthamide biosynthesis enzyme Dph2 [Candidatus Aenigmarchaeota archaeon]